MLKYLRTQIKNGEINPAWRNDLKVEVKEEKPKILKFGGFIEKEYKTAGDEILDEQMPFSELKVLTHFVSGIKKEFPVEIEVNNMLFSSLRSTMPLRKTTKDGRIF